MSLDFSEPKVRQARLTLKKIVTAKNRQSNKCLQNERPLNYDIFSPDGIKPNFQNVYYESTMSNGASSADKTHMPIEGQTQVYVDAFNIMAQS